MTVSGTAAGAALIRWAAPAGVVALAAGGVMLAGPDSLRWAGLAVTVVGAAGLLVNSWLGLATAVLAAVGVALACWATPSDIGWFALTVLAGWVAWRARPVIWGSYLAGAVTLLLAQVALHPDPGWAAWIGGTCFSAVAFWLSRRQRDLTDELRRAQLQLADQARIEERARIARDVHDVVAHSLTVSLLHISSARLAVEDDPTGAAAALSEAERLTRAALGEVRHTVGALRTETPQEKGATDATSPLPGAGQLGDLIEQVRRAGVEVDYAADTLPPQLPATTGLALYRVLQESLTNTARHAPGRPVTVRLRHAGRALTLQVRTADVRANGIRAAGTGLSSMRERAEAVGGMCTAGPDQGGAWTVTAQFPVPAAATPVTLP